ncbi:MAG: O-antigen ligase family protein [Catenisphaera adipataccumulans]|jgi:O-antigen ligase|uniref:O-antigen ligase family protein n=1 Tax=Catenisphaera adipataccumulans TaxID=700500 RepID=UPI003D8D464F
MKTIREDLRSFQKNDWLIMIMVTSIFLPHLVFILTNVVILSYLLLKGELWPYIRRQVGKKWVYGFLLLEAIVCVVYRNLLGFGVTAGFFLLMVSVGYYSQVIHPKLFHYITEWVLICSVPMIILGLIQFRYVSQLGGYSFWEFKIQNSPSRRITGTFQNANLFALMCEYVLATCLYCFLKNKQFLHRVWYVCIALANFGIILLTGCRAALVPLIFVIPILLYFAKEKKLMVVYAAALAAVLGAVVTHPTLIPRFNDFSTIESRFKIWRAGIRMFKRYPLFGNGPWTYHRNYLAFHAHKAVHCHNIYLDALVSFGIIGCAFFAYYILYIFKIVRRTLSADRLLFGFMVGMLVIVGVHGLVDGTLYPIKDDLYLLFILYSGFMYRKQSA